MSATASRDLRAELLASVLDRLIAAGFYTGLVRVYPPRKGETSVAVVGVPGDPLRPVVSYRVDADGVIWGPRGQDMTANVTALAVTVGVLPPHTQA